ncbi:uncharacterized protein AMSG_11691 [Thecamonas trahens ATCC 50062]|uniref:Uncharacterized protein n=1 Tax=Thecamonas trahens ATCC 50062 TaxID=461836 RepID=A0A0L0DVF0_THETB|nr:hypothetical protein AMSG_11691 [Thecamonas trahens ATCC 50062]KNC56142.1 hypothetical protein AMSG_11691 [Thecamonas trahens ATCC 50062]|eukprot:XP_013761230.1 hypothetical protein AMSG_11691 [Thecamonas trahens ATCC 50062]
MPTQVCTLYWPRHATSSPSGWLVGWNIGGFVAAVAAVVPDISHRELAARLTNDPALAAVAARLPAAAQLSILGRWHSELLATGAQPAAFATDSPASLNVLQQAANFWFELECAALDAPVVLREIYCCGYRYTRVAMHVVVFDPPQDDHFLAMTPLSLDVVSLPLPRPAAAAEPATFPPHTTASSEGASPQHQPPAFLPPKSGTPATVVPPIAAMPRFASLRSSGSSLPGPSIPDTGVILDHINVSRSIQAALRAQPAERAPRALPPPLCSLVWLLAVIASLVWPLVFPLLRVGYRVAVFSLLESHLPPATPASLVAISSVAKLVDERLHQLCMLPHLAAATMARFDRSAVSRAHYIHAVNQAWLLINDLVFGVMALFLVRNHAERAIQVVHRSSLLLTGGDILSSHLMWLMGWPSGFKLNANFDAFLGANFLAGIQAWRALTDWLSPANVYFSMPSSPRLYKSLADVMSSLWKLFRGKKYNLGLLLTISLLHHFPLFGLTVYARDSARLPGGIRFQPIRGSVLRLSLPAVKRNIMSAVRDRDAQKPLTAPDPAAAFRPWTTYFEIRNRPLPPAALFFQYSRVAKLVTASQPLMIWPLLSGEPIRPPPDLQYPRLAALPSAEDFDALGELIAHALARAKLLWAA